MSWDLSVDGSAEEVWLFVQRVLDSDMDDWFRAYVRLVPWEKFCLDSLNDSAVPADSRTLREKLLRNSSNPAAREIMRLRDKMPVVTDTTAT